MEKMDRVDGGNGQDRRPCCSQVSSSSTDSDSDNDEPLTRADLAAAAGAAPAGAASHAPQSVTSPTPSRKSNGFKYGLQKGFFSTVEKYELHVRTCTSIFVIQAFAKRYEV